MKIQTGRGTIPLITLIAIWSISALTSLPGLAVSPILGDLTKIFLKATDLDIQMLTSLPSLLIIPFILLGGKLTEKVDFVRVLHNFLLRHSFPQRAISNHIRTAPSVPSLWTER